MMRGFLVGAVGLVLAVGMAGCGRGSSSGSPAPGQGSGGGGGVGELTLIHDAAMGARYGGSGPRQCSTHKVPSSGAPSAEEAAKYVICGGDHESGGHVLYLMDNVVVSEVGPAERYNPMTQGEFGGIDATKPVYRIRGSYDYYQCEHLQDPNGPDFGPSERPGTNCAMNPRPAATGLCYRDESGDWQCNLDDSKTGDENKREGVGAPKD